jgi:hypothetical protein
VELQASTVLLQWAAGGLLFLWVTTRRGELGAGYGWLLRATYGALATGALVLAVTVDGDDGAWGDVRAAGAAATVVATAVALGVSVVRRGLPEAGVAARAARRARVAAMAGREPDGAATAVPSGAPGAGDGPAPAGARPYPAALDLLAPTLALVGLVGAAGAAGGPFGLALARVVVGAAFLGVITDAMLLGHWYLVQPGLRRDALIELTWWCVAIWPLELAVMLWPTGAWQVLDGTVDDGWGGLLGWVWAVSAVTTIGLVALVLVVLKERYYSAVMSATGLLYLAILTGFGMDLVVRAVLVP